MNTVKESNFQLYLRILSYLKPYVRQLTLVVIFNFGFVFFSALSMWMIAPVVTTLFEPRTTTAATDQALSADNSETNPIESSVPAQSSRFNINDWLKAQVQRWIYRDDPREMLKVLSLFIIISFALKNLFAFGEFFWVSLVEQRVIKTLRNELYSHILYQPLSFFSARKTGSIISRITNDIDQLNVAVNRSFTKLIRDPVLILIYMFILFNISWQLSLVALIIFPITTALIQQIGKSLKRKSHRVQERISEITSNLQEVITGIKVVKAFGMEPYEKRKFERNTDSHYRQVLRQVRLRRAASPLSETLGVWVMVGVLWYGGRMALTGDLLSSEDFVRFIILLFAMMDPIRSLGDLNNSLQIALASGVRIFEVMDTPPAIADLPAAGELPGFQREIQYDQVSFRYSGKDEFVLKDIHLTIAKNEKIALVGSSGAGKTTFVNLLPRFYDVSEGNIRVDGVDIRDVTQASLRQLMGIVTQEVILFNDTLSNNIAYGQEGYQLEAIHQAARLANAYDFIMEMPDQFETVIGERGVRLSGGQRQRISIARAILKNPPILIFDEATSSLDSESERLIQNAVENLIRDRTVIIIAHRLSSVINSDRIVVMENGRILDTGQHDELMERSNRYRYLFQLQFGSDIITH